MNGRRQIIHILCVKLKQPVHIFFYHEISSFLADFSQAHKLLITFNYPSYLMDVLIHQAPFFLFFLSVTLKIIAVHLFAGTYCFTLLKCQVCLTGIIL